MTVVVFRRVDEPPHLVEVHALIRLLNHPDGDGWWWGCSCQYGDDAASEAAARAAWEVHRG